MFGVRGVVVQRKGPVECEQYDCERIVGRDVTHRVVEPLRRKCKDEHRGNRGAEQSDEPDPRERHAGRECD